MSADAPSTTPPGLCRPRRIAWSTTNAGEKPVTNADVERRATQLVMDLERAHGRESIDVRFAGHPYDVDSPARKIEIKAFGGSARGLSLPPEQRQIAAAIEDPDHFYLYVVDNVASQDPAEITVRILHGHVLRTLIDAA